MLNRKYENNTVIQSLFFKSAFGILEKATWFSPQKYFVTKKYQLLQSLKDNILYFDEFAVSLGRILINKDNEQWNSLRFINISLESSHKEIEILLNPMSFNIDIKTDYQPFVFNFIENNTPIFKVNNTSINKGFWINFIIEVIDMDNIKYNENIPCLFSFNTSSLLGDLNGDGKIDIHDIMGLYNYIYNDKEVDYPKSLDINKDGIVDIQDIVELSNMVLNNE